MIKDAAGQSLSLILKSMKSVLIAYSGGVDSTFLLKAAADSLGAGVLAVTARLPSVSEKEISQAVSIAGKLKVRHMVVNVTLPQQFWRNSPDRCYFCKKALCSRLAHIAARKRIKYIADGTNADDCMDFRAGERALREAGVRSPLKEAGISKNDVRRYSRGMRLVTWNLPAMACLASRVAYGERITPKKLVMINKAEELLRSLRFSLVRVRLHGSICRIEVKPEEISRILDFRAALVKQLKSIGFKYIALDLEGYRTGSMNEEL